MTAVKCWPIKTTYIVLTFSVMCLLHGICFAHSSAPKDERKTFIITGGMVQNGTKMGSTK